MLIDSTPTVEEIEVFADDMDVQHAATIFEKQGALVVHGLMKQYIPELHGDYRSRGCRVACPAIVEGWRAPNGTLFLPAPPGYPRDKQIMVIAINYHTSAAFFRSAVDEPALDIVEAILGPNIEIFGNGQCLYKEPVGGHPKHLH